jgi:hypothetical protein
LSTQKHRFGCSQRSDYGIKISTEKAALKAVLLLFNWTSLENSLASLIATPQNTGNTVTGYRNIRASILEETCTNTGTNVEAYGSLWNAENATQMHTGTPAEPSGNSIAYWKHRLQRSIVRRSLYCHDTWVPVFNLHNFLK